MPVPRQRPPRRAWAQRTAADTQRRDTIGAMSCNPAIGGLGRGHLVREIDALDGLMGVAIDRAGIQFRVLNRSKGAAVRGPRVQADRHLYAAVVQRHARGAAGLEIVEGEAESLLVDDGRVVGLIDAGGDGVARRGGGADHRHVPARRDPSGRGALAGRAGRRQGRRSACRGLGAAWGCAWAG